MMVELTLGHAAVSMAGAAAYAAFKMSSDYEDNTPDARIYKRLYKGNTELIYVEYWSDKSQVERIMLFECKNGSFTLLKNWKAHWNAPQWSIESRKEWGWREHPHQHSDVRLPTAELLNFMSSDEF